MAVRLQDVAVHAGVSVKTVSNVVNGYQHVSSRTRARVEAAVAELGYRPNLSARNLRGGRSGIIALAVPELGVPYFAELAQLVVEASADRGFTVLIDQTGGHADQERLVLEGIRAHLIDGLIFSPLALGQPELASRRDTTPLVLLGERIGGTLADHVAIDNVTAAREAVLHLVQQGRQRVAAIGAQRDASGETAHLRLAGYRQGLKQAGLRYNAALVAETPAFHRLEGARAMARLLDGRTVPDAVFAFNDLLALGALRTCHDRGVRVPEDVALVGFDDIDDGRYSVPSLSTVSPDKEQIARVAVDLLVSRLGRAGGAPPRTTQYMARHQLVIRESSAGAAASVPLWAR
ncbi:MAG TPA: LacI family DNA-binding transcriptional regulator [Streptosporangiaceae bacterium]|jgi:DNA-binding LacI/PurR family transcriptional regulator